MSIEPLKSHHIGIGNHVTFEITYIKNHIIKLVINHNEQTCIFMREIGGEIEYEIQKHIINIYLTLLA